ncbi:MAG: hypothetical protein HC821_01740, partial [Lewinella sp.]|nr:hypothetical protein [Lewinella sp.]
MKIPFAPIALTVLVFSLVSTSLTAQRQETLLSNLDVTGLWFGLTYNYSDYGNDGALVRGFHGGLELGEKFTLGYGGWHLKDDVRLLDSNQEFDLRHSGLLLAYAPTNFRAIHPRASFIVGPGRVKVAGQQDRIFVLQPSLGAELNLFEALRLGFDLGYRY